MKTGITILKLNSLSILSFPILLLSITAKLLQKAMEKIIVFVCVGVVLLILAILNAIFNNPNNILNNLATFLAIIILFGAIIGIIFSILFFFGSIAGVIIAGIAGIFLVIFEAIFQLTHDAYSKLYDICKSDYELLKETTNSTTLLFTCIFWHLLSLFNKLIIFIFSLSLLISVICAIIFGVYSIFTVNFSISTIFGINVIEYLKLFPTTNAIFSVLYFIVIVVSIVIVIISLGIEWNEWGITLKYATQDYKQYKEFMRQKALEFDQESTTDYTFSAGKNVQKCEESLKSLQELFDNLDFLNQQVETALSIKHDTSLRYDFTAYIQLISELVTELRSHTTSIDCNYFEQRFIPLIETAKKQSKNIDKRITSILNEQIKNANKKSEIIDFFAGCETEEDTKKRYKSLCKVYHPDSNGHEETFKQLQDQYEAKLQLI
ncbi:MAG: hypothetical protein ACRC7V_00535 [Lachnospiraceae bacterium]